jgi:hypothetical protein
VVCVLSQRGRVRPGRSWLVPLQPRPKSLVLGTRQKVLVADALMLLVSGGLGWQQASLAGRLA